VVGARRRRVDALPPPVQVTGCRRNCATPSCVEVTFVLVRGARRPLIVRLLPTLVAAPVLVVVTGGPASACSCVGQDLQQSRDQADVVFAGEVLRRDAPSRWASSAPKATYVVQVDQVYKGEAAAVQEVVTVVSGATCGLELPSSGPALLFASRSAVQSLGLRPGPGPLTATLCGGSQVGLQAPPSFGPGAAPGTRHGRGRFRPAAA
jgi:hypothetical protein